MAEVLYVTFGDYCRIAAEVLGTTSELRELIKTRQVPADTRERVSRTLLMLEEFPRAGKQLSGVWRDCRALIGPWGWLIVVYM